MSYTLNWSDDSLKPPFILNNETVDKRTTSLDLTGKDLINWGEYIQEDLLRLLENFASRGIPPRSPTIGQFWYDANSDKLFLWDGFSWKTVFSAIKKPVWITPRKLTSTSNVNIQLEATNATEYNTSNLPPSLNGSGNGIVSGTLIPGVYTFNSNAIAQGVSVPKQFELTIKNTPKLPVWITPAKITIATMPLSIQFEASNTIKYVLTGGVMPYGTTFNESGLLVGECVNDLYNFTITAIGEEGSTEKTFELLVNAPPVTTTTTTTTTTTSEPSSTTTSEPSSTTTSVQPGNFVWYKPLNGDYTIRNGQFYDGDTYILNVPLNNTDPHKGAISAGTEGMESLYILSGILPPGITSNNMQIMTLVGSPTSIGAYQFMVRAIAFAGSKNSKNESTVDVSFVYNVFDDSNTTRTSTSSTSSSTSSSSTTSVAPYSPTLTFIGDSNGYIGPSSDISFVITDGPPNTMFHIESNVNTQGPMYPGGRIGDFDVVSSGMTDASGSYTSDVGNVGLWSYGNWVYNFIVRFDDPGNSWCQTFLTIRGK